ncbi:MAG TPA: TetR/AcrR family transcriptional regulator [Solirubrobacteraceae bacterium]|jgi:AcrR family transcriptional regulator|nr:TetR/AcrR family transcriptional regulator [Solirubrobacteraceae bacterium]
MPRGGEKLRSDAARNREAILTTAIGVLAGRPTASMREIALASGTGRTTLYRHFPDRQALVLAMFDRVVEEADQLTGQALADGADADPVRVVADLSAELADLGDRYRFLRHDLLSDGPIADRNAAARRRSPLRSYLTAGQHDGRIRADLDADWLLDVVIALVTEAASRPQQGLAVPRDQLRLTIQTLLTPTLDAERG